MLVIGDHRYRDIVGAIWDRSVDKDIGVVENCRLPEPDLSTLDLPDPLDPKSFEDIGSRIAARPDCFRVFCIGFSLYERAWTLRRPRNPSVFRRFKRTFPKVAEPQPNSESEG